MLTLSVYSASERTEVRRLISALSCAALAIAVVAVPVIPATADSRDSEYIEAVPSRPGWYGNITEFVKNALPQRGEYPFGYDREKFNFWVDADDNCRDTRAEVLVHESLVDTTGDCTIVTGKWVSPYDGISVTDAQDLVIDHTVPLAEAWRSGAFTWNEDQRERFANDLDWGRTYYYEVLPGRALHAVSASSHRVKGDRDPAEWMPQQKQCQYAQDWVATKLRWGLSIDSAEKAKLLALGDRCTEKFRVLHPDAGNSDGQLSVPVYRFWSPKFDNAHFYAVDFAEASTIRSGDKNWKYEGLDFRVWQTKGVVSGESSPGSRGCDYSMYPAYRFWSSKFESHFYTTNRTEADDVRKNDPNWTYEGIAFCTTGSQADTKPVHRFWSSKFGKHFYTANASEANNLRHDDPNWTYEGVAWRSPTNGASVRDPNDGT